jgi:predicted ATPase/DNA-binding CsgD family transcriptional regulator
VAVSLALHPPSGYPAAVVTPTAARARATGLPIPPRPLIGRGREVEEVAGLYAGDGARLVTLTGPGGVGKTRLALALAERLSERFPDGVYWLELGRLADAGLVLPEVAAALGVSEAGARGVADLIRRALDCRETLLVLDNLEHLLAVVPELGALLGTCPGVRLLATSREPLGLQWEQLYPVEPLGLPDSRRDPSAATVGLAPAVALFVQRARAADPAFALTDANAAGIAELCRRLDGLPLAIELAAARVRLLPPAELLARLGDRLDLLASRERDRPARHQTLREAVAWSFDLLSDEERAVLRRLAVFEGGCTLAAGEAVCGPGDVLDALGSLVDKGLLTRVSPDAAVGETRFRLLETIRAFALEQLAASGEAAEARAAHADYYLGLAETAQRERLAYRHRSAFARAAHDQDNLRAALRWAWESGQTELLAALVGALWPAWYMVGGALAEGLSWVERALAAPGLTAETALRNRLHYGAASLAARRGDFDRSEPYAIEGLSRARAAGNARLVAQIEIGLGIIASERGDAEAAVRWLEPGLAGARAADDHFYVAIGLIALGTLARRRGDRRAAIRLLEDALETARAAGDAWNPADALYNLGLVHLAAGEGAAAQARLMEAVRRNAEFDDRWALARCIEALGVLHVGDGAGAERGVRLLGAAETIRRSVGVEPRVDERERHRAAVELSRRVLGAEAFARAWADGAALAAAEVVDLAVAPVAGARPAQPARADLPGGLSEREREVVALIARGLTSREIAERLVISVKTADTHASHVRDKLNLRSRAEIAAWAVHHGLVGGA